MRVIAKTIQYFCYPVIMWLSSEMVDSYFIRAIVCSAQKEPKKRREEETGLRKDKAEAGILVNPVNSSFIFWGRYCTSPIWA